MIVNGKSKMKLLTSPTSNTYCVPTALALITGKHVDEICNLLKEKYIGDQSIGGIYIGPAISLLRELGYMVNSVAYGARLSKLKIITSKFAWTCFVSFHSHVGVVFDGKYYDNRFPEGTSTMPRYKIESAWWIVR